MAKRSSYVSNDMNKKVRVAFRRTMHLHADDCGFNWNRLAATVVDPIRYNWDRYMDSLPLEAKKILQAEIPGCNEVALLMPIEADPTSLPLNTNHHRRNRLLKPEVFVEESIAKEDDKRIYLRGIGFRFRMPEGVYLPFPSFYGTLPGEVIDYLRDGLLATPDLVGGQEVYDELLRVAKRLYRLQFKLMYMKGLTEQVADLITTPGICKRVWPEAVSFLSEDCAAAVKAARISQWPIGFKGRLRNYTNDEKDMSIQELYARLKEVTDMVLQATLAPDWSSEQAGLTDIFMCAISPSYLTAATTP